MTLGVDLKPGKITKCQDQPGQRQGQHGDGIQNRGKLEFGAGDHPPQTNPQNEINPGTGRSIEETVADGAECRLLLKDGLVVIQRPTVR